MPPGVLAVYAEREKVTQIKPPRRPSSNTIQIVDIHINVDQEIIQITEDKLRLILKDHLDSVSQSGGWVSPLSLLLSIIATFCTAKFDTFLGLGPEFWRSLFSLAGLASLVWLLVAWRKSYKALTIDELIKKIKNKS
jgi:hypothetical protein